jgi:hypothetical protein
MPHGRAIGIAERRGCLLANADLALSTGKIRPFGPERLPRLFAFLRHPHPNPAKAGVLCVRRATLNRELQRN